MTFGQAKSLNITKGWTTIVGGKGDWEEIDTRIDAIKNDPANRKSPRVRKASRKNYSSCLWSAVIRVGAATEVEMIEKKKHRIDDALEAVRSAQEGRNCSQVVV